MEKEKSNLGLYIIIVILCVALTVAVCYILFKKDEGPVVKQDEPKQSNVNNDNKFDEQQQTVEKNKSNSTNESIPTQTDKIESYLIEENDKSHDVTYELNDDPNYEDCKIVNIYYKGNKISETSDCPLGGFAKLWQIGDVIMYSVVGSDSTTYAYIIDKNGNELKKFEEFDDGMTMNGIGDWKINPKIINDTITFDVSQYGNPCGATGDIYGAVYQIKYLGNNKFSELERISEESTKEACDYSNSMIH